MRISVLIPILTATLMLSACGESDNAVQSAFNQEFRKQFIQAATTQCVEKAPKNTPISEVQLSAICGCTAETLLDQVSAEDLARLVSGELNAELTAKVSRATVECASKALNEQAASAAQ